MPAARPTVQAQLVAIELARHAERAGRVSGALADSPAGIPAERLGLSEAPLGIVAALAADAPGITAATAALASQRQR